MIPTLVRPSDEQTGKMKRRTESAAKQRGANGRLAFSPLASAPGPQLLKLEVNSEHSRLGSSVFMPRLFIYRR